MAVSSESYGAEDRSRQDSETEPADADQGRFNSEHVNCLRWYPGSKPQQQQAAAEQVEDDHDEDLDE